MKPIRANARTLFDRLQSAQLITTLGGEIVEGKPPMNNAAAHVLQRPCAVSERNASGRRSIGIRRLAGLRRCALAAALLASLGPSQAFAASAAWIQPLSGRNWSTVNNWSPNFVVPDGVDWIADFGTINITADNTVNLDSSRTVGTLKFGDTTPSNGWTLNDNGPGSILTLAVSSGTPQIQVKNEWAEIGVTLAGTQGVTISGSGTLIEFGGRANTYSGGTTINSGTLSIADDSNLGAVPSAPASNLLFTGNGTLVTNEFGVAINSNRLITISSGSTATFDTVTNAAYGGVINGGSSAALAKTDAGTLFLTGANTFGGGARLAAGVLSITSDAALGAVPTTPLVNLTFSGSSTLQFAGAFAVSSSRSAVINSGVSATFDTGGFSDSYAGAISGAGGVVKAGLGTLTLLGPNIYTGTTAVAAGTLVLDSNTGQLNSGSPLTLSGGATFVYQGATTGASQSLGALSFNGGDAVVQSSYGGAGNTALTFAALNARSPGATGTFVLTGGSIGTMNKVKITGVAANSFVNQGIFAGDGSTNNYAWNDGSSFVRAINYSTDPGAVSTAGDVTVSGTYVQANGPVTAEATNTFATLNINGANGFSLADGATLTVSGVLKTGNSAATISGGTAIKAPAGQELVVRSDGPSDALFVNSSIADNSSTPVTISGHGTVIFGGSNSYTGQTTLAGGILSLASSGALGTTGQIVFAGGTLQFSQANTTDYSSRISFGKRPISIDTNGQNVTFASIALAENGNSLTKLGAGTLTVLAGTGTGGTTINGGTLKIGSSTPLGFGPLAINGGSLDLNGIAKVSVSALTGTGGTIVNTAPNTQPVLDVVLDPATPQTFSGAILGSIAVTKDGIGTLRLAGANTFTGNTTLNAGTIELANANALQNSMLNLQLIGNANNVLTFSPSIGVFNLGNLEGLGAYDVSLTDTSGAPINLQVGSNNISPEYRGVMSGPGSLTKVGTGTLTLSGANTYTGGTTINGGTLKLASANAPVNSTVTVNVDGGLAFDSSTGTFALGGLAGSGGFVVPTFATLQIGSNNSDTTYSGVMTGGNSNITVTKTGTGTLTLSGASTTSTTTSINAGSVLLANASALQNSTVQLNVGNGLEFAPSIGAFRVGGLSGSINFPLMDTNGAPVTLTLGMGSSSTYSGAMTGGGALVMAGGLQVLSGASTFTGGTTVTGGQLDLSGVNVLSGTVTVNGGSLVLLNGRDLQNSTVVLNGGGFSAGGSILGGLSGTRGFALSSTLQVGNNNADTIYSGVISGNGSLTKIGTGNLTLSGINTLSGGMSVNAGTLTLTGANTFSGFTFLNGGVLRLGNANALQNSRVQVNISGGLMFEPTIGAFTFGGMNNSTGSPSFALMDEAGAPIVLSVGNNTTTLTFSGKMTGPGSLTKIGTGTWTLSGVNSFSGLTTVAAGTLKVTGSLASEASNTTFVSAGSDFTSADIIRRVQAAGSYGGIGSTASGTVAGLLGSSADLRAGVNSSGSAHDVAMQWRVRAMGDGPGVGSDVLNLTGMSPATGTHVQTDPFALQMTYTPTGLGGDENVLAAEGLLVLGWLDTTMNQPFGLWENATAGNFGTGLPGDVFPNVQSSWDAFAAANAITDANVGNFLGSYGVDVAHHTVWAVVNHNSQFAAVPEPASWELLAAAVALVGGLRAIGVRPRRRTSADSAV
jgi:fibronectin-binding autotransporter adhesin